MFNRRSARRRKHFLIDSNQQRRSRPKKARNRTLNFLGKLLFLRQIFQLFRGSVLLTLVILLMMGFIAFALLSPYFEIKKININRDTPHLNVEAVQEILDPFYGKNLILLRGEELKQELFDDFLEFRTIEIKEEWPDGLTISIALSPPAFTLFDMQSANFSVVSADGVILSAQPNDELPVLKIKDLKTPFTPGEKLIEKAWLEKVKNLESQ